jgi:hypothetical protein
MAISKAPSCEIRALVMHVYPDGNIVVALLNSR